jgi:hypothetical protein
VTTSADPMLERLRRLPVRLRIAHLAALVRFERTKNAGAYQSPARKAGGGKGPTAADGGRLR